MKISCLAFLFRLATIIPLMDVAITLWSVNQNIKTGYVQMYNAVGGIIYTSSSIPITYWVPFSEALTAAPRSAGVSITSFHTLITNDFSVNNTMQNFTVSGLSITSRIYGSTIFLYLHINYIAVGDSINFMQVIFNCHLCSAISVGKGPRSEARTGVTFITGYATLKANVYLAGFSLHNSDGLTNYLQADASIPSGSNIINYLFSVNQNNTASQLCYTTIVFCQKITEEELYYDYGETGNVTLSNQATQTPSIFPIDLSPDPHPDYTDEDRMFYGISSFSVSRASHRMFYMETWSYDDLANSYQTNQGTFAVRVDYFWVARRGCNILDPDKYWDTKILQCVSDCQVPTFNTIPGYFCKGCDVSCGQCDGALPGNCTSCNASHFREQSSAVTINYYCRCKQGYVDIGVAECYPCKTYIPGCYNCSSTTYCISCLSGFYLGNFRTCVCSTGQMVSGICTNITGCTNLTIYAGTAYCTECNTTLNYQSNVNFTCECMPAYYPSSNQQCLSRCGDGKKAKDQECDDGNTVQGDGCSPLCTVEQDWLCIGGSPTSKTSCYINREFNAIVKYVRRDTTANRVQIGIKIEPIVQQLTMTNFKGYITHNIPCEFQQVKYENGLLTLSCEYSRTIEGQNFNFDLMLDQNIFYDSLLTVSIPASGMNAKLTYDENNSINKPMEIIVIILDVIAIIIMFVACISEKMIGIEMIQTIQTVLYTQAVMKTTPSSLSPLQMLRYSSGFNQPQGIDYSRTYTFSFSLSSIGLEKQFLLSYNIMYIILIVVIVACVILKVKQQCHQIQIAKSITPDDEIKNKERWSSTNKIYNFIFERVLFVTVFMCMFLVVFSLMLQMTNMQSSYHIISDQFNILGGIIAIAVIVTMISGVILNGCFPGTLIFPMLMKQYYPPIYFIYQSAFIFILAVNYVKQYTLLVLAIMSFLFLLYNLFYRPYPQKMHTFVLIFHQMLIIGIIGIYAFENLTKPNQNQRLYKIANVVIIALLYLVVILNGYRIYAYYNFLKFNRWDQYGNRIDLYYDQMIEEYKNLQTPKTLKGTRFNQRYNSNIVDRQKIKPIKTQRYDDMKQMQQIRKSNKDKTAKLKPSMQDQSNLNWNYNSLAEGYDNRKNSPKRDIMPDFMRDQNNETKVRVDEISSNQGKKKDSDEKNLDEQNTNKDINDKKKSSSQFKGKNNTILGNLSNQEKSINDGQKQGSDVFDNPYDEKGYQKQRGDKSVYAKNQDRLEAIKKKMKQDYKSKIKNSTFKQS